MIWDFCVLVVHSQRLFVVGKLVLYVGIKALWCTIDIFNSDLVRRFELMII